MKIKDILELENSNSGSIILHKEGLFLRAYEKSAYLFVNNIKQYQIIKKFYKNVKQEVVYLGFPQNSLEQILNLAKEKEINKKETQIIIDKYKLSNKEYVDWKENFAGFKSPQNLSLSEKIINFPIANKTPVECQQFLIGLQNELQIIQH